MRTTVGLLHPGEMGASVAAALARAGSEVLWSSEGRSAASRARADSAGLEDAADLGALLERRQLVVSVCPPDAALEQAQAVAKRGFAGIYVDANAVSPATAREIGEIVRSGSVLQRNWGRTKILILPPVGKNLSSRQDHGFRAATHHPWISTEGP